MAFRFTQHKCGGVQVLLGRNKQFEYRSGIRRLLGVPIREAATLRPAISIPPGRFRYLKNHPRPVQNASPSESRPFNLDLQGSQIHAIPDKPDEPTDLELRNTSDVTQTTPATVPTCNPHKQLPVSDAGPAGSVSRLKEEFDTPTAKVSEFRNSKCDTMKIAHILPVSDEAKVPTTPHQNAGRHSLPSERTVVRPPTTARKHRSDVLNVRPQSRTGIDVTVQPEPGLGELSRINPVEEVAPNEAQLEATWSMLKRMGLAVSTTDTRVQSTASAESPGKSRNERLPMEFLHNPHDDSQGLAKKPKPSMRDVARAQTSVQGESVSTMGTRKRADSISPSRSVPPVSASIYIQRPPVPVRARSAVSHRSRLYLSRLLPAR